MSSLKSINTPTSPPSDKIKESSKAPSPTGTFTEVQNSDKIPLGIPSSSKQTQKTTPLANPTPPHNPTPKKKISTEKLAMNEDQLQGLFDNLINGIKG